MGQRHQIYIKLPEKFAQPKNQETDTDFVTSTIAGLFHSWLYGSRPIKKLHTILQMNEKNPNFVKSLYSFDRPDEALAAIYSVNFEEGSYDEPVIPLSHKFTKNPALCENNDGITIIDLRKPKNPKYCFMFLEENDRPHAPIYTPLSGREYLDIYYGNKELSAKDKEFLTKIETTVLSAMGNYSLLSISDVLKIFPTFKNFLEQNKTN